MGEVKRVNNYAKFGLVSLLSLTSAFMSLGFVQIAQGADTFEDNVFHNDMDQWLEGTWEVLQVQIEQGGQAIIFANHGATLTFLDSGSFKYDYTSESNGPRVTDIAAGDYITTTQTSPVGTCKMEETGEGIGHVFAYQDMFDETDQKQLLVNFFPDASTSLEIRCMGSSNVVSNLGTPSLGMARPTGTNGGGPFVAYGYVVETDDYSGATVTNRNLEIWTIGEDPVRTRYYLRKID